MKLDGAFLNDILILLTTLTTNTEIAKKSNMFRRFIGDYLFSFGGEVWLV